MKILHTSDWHLGRSLYGRKRYQEFALFLDWLAEIIGHHGIDVLLVAGDIFDTSMPSNRAQELYYRFLCKVSHGCCRHIVVIAGNHDSPSFLNAPKEILKALNVNVVGAITDDPEDEIIVLTDPDNKTEAIICAVPYLRDRDIRTVKAGESIDDKNKNLVKGLQRHYADVCAIAEAKQQTLGGKDDLPIIAMGHLFTVGGKTIDGDGVRELYVGSLAYVGLEVFPSTIDYLALGHLHVPQCVGKQEHLRYSGSPIPMGYGEAKQEKQVLVVEFKAKTPTIQKIIVPCFQPLEKISGPLDKIQTRLDQLKSEKSNAWLEIEYTGSEIINNLRELLDEIIAGSSMEIRRISNKRMVDRVINSIHENETLDDLDVNDVFNRCLDAFEVPLDDRSKMTETYNEIIKSLYEEDVNAE